MLSILVTTCPAPVADLQIMWGRWGRVNYHPATLDCQLLYLDRVTPPWLEPINIEH